MIVIRCGDHVEEGLDAFNGKVLKKLDDGIVSVLRSRSLYKTYW